jgi:hypothetical protein
MECGSGCVEFVKKSAQLCISQEERNSQLRESYIGEERKSGLLILVEDAADDLFVKISNIPPLTKFTVISGSRFGP